MLVATIARVPEGRESKLCKKITFSDLFDNPWIFYFKSSREFFGIRITGILTMRKGNSTTFLHRGFYHFSMDFNGRHVPYSLREE